MTQIALPYEEADRLTGLYNRNVGLEKVAGLIESAKNKHVTFYVTLLDLSLIHI